MRFWFTLNMLSIDIAVGAVVGCAFFGHILSVTLVPHTLVALGLSVWVIYTADHLSDAYKLTSRGVQASTERHQFHQKYFTELLMMVIAASLTIGLSLFYISPVVRNAGMILAVPIAFYLLLQHRLKLTKELSGAILYTCGIVLAPLALVHRDLEFLEATLVALYGLTAFANLLYFSLVDHQSDLQDQSRSFATNVGFERTRKIFYFLIALNITGCIFCLSTGELRVPGLIILSMNSILVSICLSGKRLPRDHYRLVADAIFFIPLIGLWV